MKGSKKRKVTIGIVLMLLSTGCIAQATLQVPKKTTNLNQGAEGEIISSNFNEEKKMNVAIGPPGAKNLNQCEIINSISASDAKEFKLELENFQSTAPNLNILNLNQKFGQIKKIFKILLKYNIINDEVPFVENILNYETKDNQNNNNLDLSTLDPDPGVEGYLCVGPTLFVYYSWFDSAFCLQFPRVPPFSGTLGRMGKFINKLNISEDSNPLLYTFLNITNATYFMYATYATVQILSGGGLGHYYSFSVVDTMYPNTFDFVGPFIGMYILCGSIGIYIFEEQDIENPWFDLIIGLSPFLSMQMKIDSLMPGRS